MSKDKRFVLVLDTGDSVFCLGIFPDHRTAIGEAMLSLWDLKDSYRREGSVFEYDEFSPMEGEGGMIMTVKFKAPSWSEADEHYYYILYSEE